MGSRFPPIPRFVTPLPDESCYSILCRCMVYAATSTAKMCMGLFGRQQILSNYLWQPFRPENTEKWFDDADERTACFLREHSCIPYRFSFVESKSQAYLNNWHEGKPLSNGHYKRVTRVLGYRNWKKEYLYFCPECVKSDRKQYGETYWHMIPQLPGVVMCPEHHVPVVQSNLKVKDTKYELHPAEHCIPTCVSSTEVVSPAELQIAIDSKWMMENGWQQKGHSLPILEKGLSSCDYEMAEAALLLHSTQINAKSETLYYILLANAQGKSISEFM